MRNTSTTSFLDILFNLLLGFVFLFMIAFIMINPVGEDNKHDIVKKAEYLVVMEWDDDADVDIDLWVKSEEGQVVGFTNMRGDWIHLERDDYGSRGDTVDTGEIIAENEETIVFRGVKPGTYTVNAHYYTSTTDTRAVTVSIKLIKVNPYRIITAASHRMEYKGQEITFFNFTIEKSKVITNINTLENHFVNMYLRERQGEEARRQF